MAYPKSAYKQHILALAGDGDPAVLLAASRDELARIFDQLGDRWRTSYEPGKWTAAEIVCHLADVEMTMGYRLRQALSEDHHQIQPIDENRWAQRYANLDATLARRSFDALRAWNLALIVTLSEDDKAKASFHPERGPEPVGEIIRMLAGHDRNHLAQLHRIMRPGT